MIVLIFRNHTFNLKIYSISQFIQYILQIVSVMIFFSIQILTHFIDFQTFSGSIQYLIFILSHLIFHSLRFNPWSEQHLNQIYNFFHLIYNHFLSFFISSNEKELSFLPHQENKLKYFWYYWNHHFAMKLISLMKSTFQYFWILLYHLFLNTSISTRNLKSTWNCLTWSFIKWYFHHKSKLFDLICESHSYDY